MMERYESLGLVGEGSYGTVLKCRHRDSGRLVAIKKFMDSDDDKTVKKIALREIKLLRQLRHDNLVNLLEVWKRRRRWHLVFEFVERTLLDDLEQNSNGLDLNTSRLYLYQVLRATAFCHQQHIIHRDIKPENILISQGGVVKLCDFGFARTMTSPADGGVYTDYVATRWYRAPELLVGDTKYGKPVDVWAVGCLSIEMLTGQPLFPGDSDLDQIYHIISCFGDLTANHQELFYRNTVFSGVRLPQGSVRIPLEQRFPTITSTALDLAQSCLQMDPERRAQCSELLEHTLFTQDSFHIRVLDELNAKIQKDHRENSTLPKIPKTPRPKKDEGDEKNRRGKDKKKNENVDEKVNKEKEKRDEEGGEKKTPKTKGKNLSKTPKTVWNTSEPAAMRSKPGKARCTELGKEPEVSKPTKTLTSDSLETSKITTYLKYNNKTKRKHCPEPMEAHVTKTNTKDKESTGSDNTGSGVMEIRRSSKSESIQDFGKSTNTKVPKLYKSSTTDHPNESSSPRASTTEPTASFIKEVGNISIREYPSSKIPSAQERPNLTQKTSQPTSRDHIEVSFLSVPSVVKSSKTEIQISRSNVEFEALPSNSRPFKTTSSSKMTKSLSTSPSETLTSDLSVQASPAPSIGTLHTSSVPNQPSRGHPTDSELPQVFMSTNNQQDSCNSCRKMSLMTKPAANNIEISNRKPEPSEPCSIHLWNTSKITTESRKTSIPIPNAVPTSSLSVGATVTVSDRENREHFALSVPISATTESSGNRTSEDFTEQTKNREPEPSMRSFKPPHCKSLTGQVKIKLEAFSNNKETVTHKSRFSMETQINNKSTETPDHKALTGSSGFHNTDTADGSDHSSPPPPPSSTPLQIPPSSTPPSPSFTVISTSSPAASDHLKRGACFHPGTHILRSVDKQRHQGGIYSRLDQQSLSSHTTGSLPAALMEKSPIRQRSFMSDRCNHGNSNGITVAKRKSDIYFPDLRSSVPPEFRGLDSKHSKGAFRDQRKDKPVMSSNPASEPQLHEHN